MTNINAINIINLTPHKVVDVAEATFARVYPPSGVVARCATTKEEVAFGYFLTKFGEVEGLPGLQPGTFLIVSALVRTALPERGDIISPGELVRDENGQPTGCQGFNVNQGFYKHLTGGKFSSPEEEQEHFEFLDSLSKAV